MPFPTKIKKHSLSVMLLIVCAFLLTGCVNVATSEAVRPSETSTPEPSKTPESTKTEHPPKQLTEKERKLIIADMLQTNNHCALPCFMGVELQRSTLADIEALFLPSMGPGLITRYQSTDEIVYGSGFETENLMLGSFGIHLHEDKTDGIHLHLGSLSKPEVDMADWAPYTIKGVFSQLGPPSRIFFKIHGPPNETSDRGMIISYYLYYESMNTIIAYNGEKTEDVPKFRFCPMLQKPEFIGISIGSYTKDITVAGTDLEEASTYSIDEFYNLDWSNFETCIDLDTNALKSHQ